MRATPGTRTTPALLVGLGITLTLLFPQQALAALSVTFDPPAASPGTEVTVTTIGDGAAVGAKGSQLRLYIAPSTGADDTPIDVASLIPVGILTVDEAGNGRGELRVPQTAPGVHDVYLQCEPCAQFSAGRTLLPVGVLEVLPDSDAKVPIASIGGVLAVAVLLGIGLIAVATKAQERPAKR